MTEVLLRNYVEEMRANLGEGNFSQVLALGNHILCFYPKHLESYQILAETNLEMSEMDAAADLFSRVRSADPENLVALLGLSIIYEHRGQIDEAIWHLEQAFEIQSSNAELRKELLRLYEAHDGAPRGRLKLTPGALARLHARQGLYAQAIQEFRAILRQSAERLDLQVALAEALYREGHKQEAAQIAQTLLQSLPFCLKANLLLGVLWAENGVTESEALLKRALALDPERNVARDLQIDLWDQEPAPSLPEYKGPAVSAVHDESSEWGGPDNLAAPAALETPTAPVLSQPLPADENESEAPVVPPGALEEEAGAGIPAESAVDEAVPWLQNIYHSSPAEPAQPDQPPVAENEVSLPWLEELYAGEEQARAPLGDNTASTEQTADVQPAEPLEHASDTAETEHAPEQALAALSEHEPGQVAEPVEITPQAATAPEPIVPVDHETLPEGTLAPVGSPEPEPVSEVTESPTEPAHDLGAIAEPNAAAEPAPQVEQIAEPQPAPSTAAETPVQEMQTAPTEPQIAPIEQALAADVTLEGEHAPAEVAEPLPATTAEAPLALEFLEEETKKAAALETPSPAAPVEGMPVAKEILPPEKPTETEPLEAVETPPKPVEAQAETAAREQPASPTPEQSLLPRIPTSVVKSAVPTIKPTIQGSASKLPAWIRASLTREPPLAPAPAVPPEVSQVPVPTAPQETVSEPEAEKKVEESSESPQAETDRPINTGQESAPVIESAAAPQTEPVEAPPEVMDKADAPQAEPAGAPPSVEDQSVAPVSIEAAPAAEDSPVQPAATPRPAQPGPEAAAESRGRLPTDPESLLAGARELRAAGNTAGALDYYERAMQRGPRMVPTIIAELEELVQEPDAPVSSHRLLGDAYAMAGRFKEALAQYRMVLNK